MRLTVTCSYFVKSAPISEGTLSGLSEANLNEVNQILFLKKKAKENGMIDPGKKDHCFMRFFFPNCLFLCLLTVICGLKRSWHMALDMHQNIPHYHLIWTHKTACLKHWCISTHHDTQECLCIHHSPILKTRKHLNSSTFPSCSGSSWLKIPEFFFLLLFEVSIVCKGHPEASAYLRVSSLWRSSSLADSILIAESPGWL